jgi:hypothetical protein
LSFYARRLLHCEPFRRGCNHLRVTRKSQQRPERKTERGRTVDEEVGTSDVGSGLGGEEEEGTLELLDVTLATEDGLAVDAEEGKGKASVSSRRKGRKG